MKHIALLLFACAALAQNAKVEAPKPEPAKPKFVLSEVDQRTAPKFMIRLQSAEIEAMRDQAKLTAAQNDNPKVRAAKDAAEASLERLQEVFKEYQAFRSGAMKRAGASPDCIINDEMEIQCPEEKPEPKK